MSIDWKHFSEIVNSNERFLLVSHIRPDCDALGSELGMAGVLQALGKSVRIVNGHATPPNLDFIDPEHKIETIGKDVKAEELSDIQVVMILDTSAWAQIGPMSDFIKQTSAQVIILDHHVSEDKIDAIAFKNTKAEATGRLVVEAAEALGVALTPEIAMPLFAAIATDTGWFRFGSAGSTCYRTGAKLIDAGARPAEIYGALYERETVGRVRLRGRVLARVETELNGQLVYTYIEKADFAATGALPSDTEDLINLSLAIEGTEFAVIFVEQADGGFKLSFRSRCALDCSQIAENFGGGGHKAAAGAFVSGTLSEVRDLVLPLVRQEMALNPAK
jgi:phosphoesterase RecJ-like protein